MLKYSRHHCCPGKNKRFFGVTRNGFPFIGILTYLYNGREYTEIGEFNENTRLVGTAKDTWKNRWGYRFSIGEH